MISNELDIVLYGVAAAVGAVTVALLLIFIQQRNYLRLAIAVTLGMILMQYTQAILLMRAPRLDDVVADMGTGVPAHPLLLVVLGSFMVIAAFTQWRASSTSSRMNERLSSIMPRIGVAAAFAIGFALMLTNVKNWALAVATVSTATDFTGSATGMLGTYSLFVLVAQAPMIALILLQVISSDKSRNTLDRLSDWLTVNGNYVVAIVTGLIGLVFVTKGLPEILNYFF